MLIRNYIWQYMVNSRKYIKMDFIRLSLTIIFFISTSALADDFGPVKVDESGYISDRAGETIKKQIQQVPQAPVPESETPVIEVAQTDRQEVTPEVIPAKESMASVGELQEENGASGVMLLSCIIIFLLIVAVTVLFARKKVSGKKDGKSNDDGKTLAEKITETEKTFRSEVHLLDKTPIAGPSVLSTRNFDQYANETEVDDMGRNPSGIIIDEDKYFGRGSNEFQDEDKN